MFVSSFPFHLLSVLGLLLLQSTWLQSISPWGIVPDLALIFIIFSSHHHGSGKGQITGFVAGLVEDILGMSPLGFNAFIKLTIGLVSGSLHGLLTMDYILFPMTATAVITLARNVMGWVLALIFIPSEAMPVFWGKGFFIELGMNVVLAPILFSLFKLLGFWRKRDRP